MHSHWDYWECQHQHFEVTLRVLISSHIFMDSILETIYDPRLAKMMTLHLKDRKDCRLLFLLNRCVFIRFICFCLVWHLACSPHAKENRLDFEFKYISTFSYILLVCTVQCTFIRRFSTFSIDFWTKSSLVSPYSICLQQTFLRSVPFRSCGSLVNTKKKRKRKRENSGPSKIEEAIVSVYVWRDGKPKMLWTFHVRTEIMRTQ